MKTDIKSSTDISEKARLTELNLHESKLYSLGFNCLAGIDEVGRGPLAGPVLACAVILPPNCHIPGINDSKLLTEKRREALLTFIQMQAIEISYGWVDEKIIDEINILNATHLAMKKALDNLKTHPDAVLIDGRPVPGISIPQTSIIKGDQKSVSIAAASIAAKVTRDKLMQEYDYKYPFYDFKNNKGYGTKKHLAAIEKYGLCEIHRLSFKPCSQYSVEQRGKL